MKLFFITLIEILPSRLLVTAQYQFEFLGFFEILICVQIFILHKSKFPKVLEKKHPNIFNDTVVSKIEIQMSKCA